MLKKIAAIFLLALAAAAPALAQNPDADLDKLRLLYQSTPFLAEGVAVPEVLLVLSKDHKMFQQAYGGLIDMDGDGRIDTGFNPNLEKVVYYGYFDSYSCYEYKGNVSQNGDENGYFTRVKAADPATGVCQAPHTAQGGYFSGNWLNFVTATRMDVIRKILYGGFRQVDTAAQTILESSFVPNDAHVWGTDVVSDDRWVVDSPLNPRYDISQYTAFPKPSPGKAHFFARVRSFNTSNYATLRYLLNADKDKVNGTLSGNSQSCPAGQTSCKGRYFDWVMDGQPNPSDSARLTDGNNGGKAAVRSYAVRAEVCKKSSFAETENCREYPNGNLKPIGLLQKYGVDDKMFFGLLTGSYKTGSWRDGTPREAGTWTDDYRNQGGVLRQHLGSISEAVDAETGLIKKPKSGTPRTDGNIIWALDTLRISGRDDNNTSANYANADSWGNPIGEMLYEGVRYFARRAQPAGETPLKPTPAFVPSAETAYNAPGSAAAAHFPAGYANYQKDWVNLPKIEAGDCAKPVILLISETDSAFDGDQGVNSSPSVSGLKRPKLEGLDNVNLPDFDMAAYLKAITGFEKERGGSLTGSKYIFATQRTDDCRPKELTDLGKVAGICPNGPAFEGTYSAAAVAYYAHTHNFSPVKEKSFPIDVYAVTLSGAFPELTFAVKDSSGQINKKITLLPASMSARSYSTTINRIVGFINYYIVDWKVDSRGLPYHVHIRVNFEDAVQGYNPDGGIQGTWNGSDWDMDMIVDYIIDIVTDGSTSPLKRDATPLDFANTVDCTSANASTCYNGANTYSNKMASGILKFKGGIYYKFQDLKEAQAIEPHEAKGLIVESRKMKAEASIDMVAGYTISGSTRDGTYMDRGHHQAGSIVSFKYATPPSCNWPAGYGSPTAHPATGGSCLNSAFSTTNKQNLMVGNRTKEQSPEEVSHTRTFEFNSDPLAAGEFLPGPLWLAAKYGGFTDRNGDGRPNPATAEQNEWEGADGNPKNYFQAKNIAELPEKLEQAFQSIAKGTSTGTATSASVNSVLGGGISIQTLYYPEYKDPLNDKLKVKWLGAVYGLFVDKWGNLREDSDGDGKLTLKNGKQGDAGFPQGDLVVTFDPNSDPNLPPVINRWLDEKGNNKDLKLYDSVASAQKLKAVWDLSRQLAADGAPARRNIYYGPKLNDFQTTAVDSQTEGADLTNLLITSVPDTKKLLPGYAGNRAALAKALISYIRGEKVSGWRPREVSDPWNGGKCDPVASPGPCITWRLGDIINSKPIIAGAPAANYDLRYGDQSYYAFKQAAAQRRHVAYFGANDGFLHAVNIGFYGSLKDGQVGYQKTGTKNETEQELGKELWAYLPEAVLPHLQWLADPEYTHGYFVDMKPLIVDMRIGDPADKYKGWRTVLIGGLRLGGREIEAGDGNMKYSEVFALDITDPETKPEFLWSYSADKLGLSVGLPTAVARDGKWYVVLASGPKTALTSDDSPYDGYSDQRARLIVLRADIGISDRDREVKPNDPEDLTVAEGRSFFSDSFLPLAVPSDDTENYNHGLIYYGLTVSRQGAACEDTGALYRLDLSPDSPDQWKLKRFINLERPVTGAANATRDGQGRLWVVFGSGRLWGRQDLRPCAEVKGTSNVTACDDNHRQFIYGLKEPLDLDGTLSMDDLTPGAADTADKLAQAGKIVDVSKAKVYKSGVVTGLQGQPGLGSGAFLSNGSIQYSALAAEIQRDEALGFRRALATSGLLETARNSYEMVLTQPKIDGLVGGGSYMAFTTYEPPESACGEDGRSFLHLADTFTGLPAPDMFDLFSPLFENKPAVKNDGLVTGYREAGGGKATEAIIMKVNGATIVRTSGQDGSIYDIPMLKGESQVTGVISWREPLDMGHHALSSEEMLHGLGQ